MRKVVALAVVGLLAASALGAPATAAKKKKVKQTVDGSVAVPTVFYNDTSKCYAGLHRRFDTASNGTEQGVTGYHFDLDKKTWNKKFALKTTSETPADLDIYFYIHYPTVEEWPNDPQNAGTPLSVDFTNRNTDGEFGKVPPQTTKAIVCVYGGDPATATTQVSFNYSAGAGVKSK